MNNDAEIYYHLEFVRAPLPPFQFSFTAFLKGVSNLFANLANFIEDKQLYCDIASLKVIKQSLVENIKGEYRMVRIEEVLKAHPIIQFSVKGMECSFIVDGHRFQNIDDAERAAQLKAFL